MWVSDQSYRWMLLSPFENTASGTFPVCLILYDIWVIFSFSDYLSSCFISIYYVLIFKKNRKSSSSFPFLNFFVTFWRHHNDGVLSESDTG